MRRAADGDAEAGHRRADQHDGIAELRPAADRRGGQARALEPAAPAEPGLFGAGVGVVQQRIVGERGQRIRHAAAAEQLRARHGKQFFAAQQLALQPAPGRGREADGEVDGVAAEIHDLPRRAQHHVDARRPLAKAVHARQQPAIGEGGERGDA